MSWTIKYERKDGKKEKERTGRKRKTETGNERKRNTELEVAQSDKHCAVTSLVVPSARDEVLTGE